MDQTVETQGGPWNVTYDCQKLLGNTLLDGKSMNLEDIDRLSRFNNTIQAGHSGGFGVTTC